VLQQDAAGDLFNLKQYKWYGILTYTIWKLSAFRIKTMSHLQQQGKVEKDSHRITEW